MGSQHLTLGVVRPFAYHLICKQINTPAAPSFTIISAMEANSEKIKSATMSYLENINYQKTSMENINFENITVTVNFYFSRKKSHMQYQHIPPVLRIPQVEKH